jgi:hypothetical protein
MIYSSGDDRVNSSSIETESRFRVVNPKIIWQCFDDELVVINLESGKYYSLNGTGAAIWKLMDAGCSPAGAVEQTANGDCIPELREQVLGFWQRLVEEGLIRESPDGGAPQTPTAEPTPPRTQPWEPPTLATYADMEDLFLLDPIHDVDEAGWPSRAPEAS